LDYDLFIATSFSEIWVSSDAIPGTFGATYVNTLDNTSGKVFRLAAQLTNVFQDNGSAYTMTIQTEPIVLNDGRGFIINSIELLADTQPSGSSALAYSADDYANFTSYTETFDLTAARKEISPGGYFDNHVIFKLTDSGNQPWRGQALKINWEPCP